MIFSPGGGGIDNLVSAVGFGAKGDNSTDDSAAIQAALDAIDAMGGGVLWIPPGTYRLATVLSIGDRTKVMGAGDSTILRCSGNNYALKFDACSWSTITDLYIDAVSTQASGGGIDWRTAGARLRTDKITFGANLHSSMDMRCSVPSGIWQITDTQWDGGNNRTYGFRIGDGTNLITDISIKGVIASGYGATETWFDVNNKVDTLKCVDVTCYGGAAGMVLGQSASEAVTGLQLTNVLMDNMTGTGIHLVKVRGATLVGCDVQTCDVGIDVGGLSEGTSISAGVVQGNAKSGIIIRNGAVHTNIIGVHVADNNSLWNGSAFVDGGTNQGIDVAANTEWFRISNCSIGNYLLGRGFQRYGIRIASGSSDHYQIIGNSFDGNDTDDMSNSATGTDGLVINNVNGTGSPWTTPSLSGVTNYNNAAYRKRNDKTVECRGEIQASSNLAANSTLFTFPVGLRPTIRCYLPITDFSGSSGVAVVVGSDGTVKNVTALSNTNVYSLASVRFPTP